MDRASIFIDEAIDVARRNNGRAFIPGPDGNPALVILTPSHYESLANLQGQNPAKVKTRPTRKERKLRAADRERQANIERNWERRRRHSGHELNRRRKRGQSIF